MAHPPHQGFTMILKHVPLLAREHFKAQQLWGGLPSRGPRTAEKSKSLKSRSKVGFLEILKVGQK